MKRKPKLVPKPKPHGRHCARPWCVAMAVRGDRFCAVHAKDPMWRPEDPERGREPFMPGGQGWK